MDNNLIYILIGVGMALVIQMGNQYSSQKKIEKKIDMLIKHFKISESPVETVNQEIIDLIDSGKNVKAIKKYREISGLGLKEAKDHIDQLVRERTKEL